MPFKFEDGEYYSKSEVRDLVEPAGIDVETFLARLKPRKVFKGLYRGKDLNEAYERASALEDSVRRQTPEPTLPDPQRRRSPKQTGKTYGGFTPEVLGLERAR